MQHDIEPRTQELVEDHLSYAAFIAKKMTALFKGSVDFDDLYGYACSGLIEASHRFNEDYGVQFKVFAHGRIKGAIFDGLRAEGLLSRSHLSVEELRARRENLFGNINVQPKNYGSGVVAGHVYPKFVAMERPVSVENVEDLDMSGLDHLIPLDEQVEMPRMREKVFHAIESLPDKMRKLIKMYYFQNRTLHEIGEHLCLSKSWTSRLHTRALDRLSKKLHRLQWAH